MCSLISCTCGLSRKCFRCMRFDLSPHTAASAPNSAEEGGPVWGLRFRFRFRFRQKLSKMSTLVQLPYKSTGLETPIEQRANVHTGDIEVSLHNLKPKP
jgi:hypothetical protein